MADLRTEFLGIKSPNPFWLASAPPTDKEVNVRRAFEAGWGGVVWKTLGEDGPPVVNVNGPRYGALLTVEEAGGWAEWRLHSALVRDGTVLAWVLVIDIRADAEPYFTVDQVGRMVETAVGLL